MSAVETWTATVTITVHGLWEPRDENLCADLIATVNRLRSPGNSKPCVRRGWWSNDEDPWLDVEIGRCSIRLNAGDHLVHVVKPDGSAEWLALDDEDLDQLRPAQAVAA